jgi:hypothetical protein
MFRMQRSEPGRGADVPCQRQLGMRRCMTEHRCRTAGATLDGAYVGIPSSGRRVPIFTELLQAYGTMPPHAARCRRSKPTCSGTDREKRCALADRSENAALDKRSRVDTVSRKARQGCASSDALSPVGC